MSKVDEGAALLDELYGPTWDELIDLDRLNLACPCNCVLGQIEMYDSSRRGDPYGRRLFAIAEVVGGVEETYDLAERFGFNVGRRGFRSYERLTAAWRRLIRRRREARHAHA